MPKNPHGTRHSTRLLFTKSTRERGLAPLGRLMYEYSINERIDIIPDSAIHKTLPHRRFVGKVGTIIAQRGRAYMVSVTDGKKEKVLFLRKEHIRPSKQIR